MKRSHLGKERKRDIYSKQWEMDRDRKPQWRSLRCRRRWVRGAKQNKNNESLNTTQNSGIGAVFTLVGSQGRLKAEEDELSCVRAERERWELTTGGGAPMGRSPGGRIPLPPLSCPIWTTLATPKDTHTHTHTHVSPLSNQTSLMPSFFICKMRKQDIVISRLFPALKHWIIWLCNRLCFILWLVVEAELFT